MNVDASGSVPAPAGRSVDVVIPVHDGRRWVGDAIESALAQDPPPARVIVVDDGSTDGTADEVARFGDRVTLVRHDRCRGLPAARNTGIRHGDADLVAFLDADDAWLPGMIAAQLEEFARHPEIGLCYTRSLDCDENLVPLRERPFRRREAESCFEELYREAFPIPPSATFVPRRVLADVGPFDERLRKAQDHELWLRIALLYPLSCLDRALCARRLHPASISSASSVELAMWCEEQCFLSIERFAAARGKDLPFPAAERVIVSRRRRIREMLGEARPRAALAYRADLRRRGAWRLRDEVRFWPRLGIAWLRGLSRLPERRGR